MSNVKAEVWRAAARFVNDQREEFDGDLRQVRDRMYAIADVIEKADA